MNLVRKYKLVNIGIEIDSDSKKIISYLEDNIFNLKLIEFKRFDYKFFIKNENIIFTHFLFCKKFYIDLHYKHIENIRLLIKPDNQIDIIMSILSEHYKIEIDNIHSACFSDTTNHEVCIDRVFPYRKSMTGSIS